MAWRPLWKKPLPHSRQPEIAPYVLQIHNACEIRNQTNNTQESRIGTHSMNLPSSHCVQLARAVLGL
jgi:hypothetical protein